MSLQSVSAQFRQRTGLDAVEEPKKSKAKAKAEPEPEETSVEEPAEPEAE